MITFKQFFQSLLFMLFSSIGGFLFSLTGIEIGWMIGTIVLAALIHFRLSWSNLQNGLPPYWLRIGQLILAIEMGRKLNLVVLHTVSEHMLTIAFMLLVSILLSLLSGFIVWRFTSTDLLTSLFATAPGGVSTMPGIAEEVGANTAIVSIIQTIRIFCVVLTIPMIASSSWLTSISETVTSAASSATIHPEFRFHYIAITLILVAAAWGGYYIGRFLRLPAPWLVGGMLGVALLQSIYSSITGRSIVAWWPHSLIILSQIFIAASIGSRFHKRMFAGIKKTVLIASVSTIGLVAAMFGCAYAVSELTGISFTTSMLAFAPGGVAEMAATAIVLHADATFVVAVQVLRIVFVLLVLPPLFRAFNKGKLKQKADSQAPV